MELQCWYCDKFTKFRCKTEEQSLKCPCKKDTEMKKPVKIQTKWFVVGNSVGTMFVDYDSNSGYPYSSDSSFRRGDLQQAYQMLNDARSMYIGYENPKVYRIVLEEVSTDQLEKAEKQVDEILKNLSADQVQILKKKLSKGRS
jgi:hypothetical protein